MAEKKQLGQFVRLLMAGVGILIAIMTIMGLASRSAMNDLAEANRWVVHTERVMADFATLEKLLVDAETGQRGFLFTRKNEFLEPYDNATKLISADVAELLTLVQDNPEQVRRIQVIETLAMEKMNELGETITLARANREEELMQLVVSGKGKAIMDEIRQKVEEAKRIENQLLAARQGEVEQIQNNTNRLFIIGTVGAALFGIAMLFYLTRKITQPITAVANEIISAASELASTAEQHERTASQQASAATETSATITELSASSRQSAEQAANASNAAEQASATTAKGGDTTREAVAAMNELKNRIGEIADQILRLGEQTGQIGSIATLVKDLSGQINMLALNAAVEAARAGEHGKGFAVVAAEVRKLADQSRKSAEQATALVGDIQKATHSSIMMTEEGSRTVAETTQLTQKVADLFADLAGMASSVNENAHQVMLNAKQQSAAFAQIVSATDSIAAGAKETAAGISQTKVGVRHLNEAAENLRKIA